MSIVINSFAKKAWKYYISQGMTPEGAAGLMGNQYYESDGFVASRVEYLCLQRLRENGKNYTQETYTKAIDSGEISRAEFLNPLPNKQYGYGLSQLTTPVPRKSELYDRTVAKGKSIADEDIQLEYTVYELKKRYPSVWKVLTTTNSLKTASDTVLRDFEVPAYWESQSATRLSFAQDYYNYFKNQTNTTPQKGSNTMSVSINDCINAIISLAKAEDGYMEKDSSANLDSKTAGAGYGNYTKYWRDIGYNSWQGQPYCACFISWLFMKAFGLDTAKKLLGHWPFVYCPTLASMTSNKTPKVGSIILFYRNGEYVHTGYVIGVTSTTVTTVEGNTSGGSTIVPNGGQVVYGKIYNRSSLSSMTKYYTPDYSIVTKILTTTSTNTSSASTSKTVDSSASLSEVSKWKGKVNKANAPVRTWAGSDYKEVSFSPLKKNTEVEVCDTIQDNKKRDWYYIKFGDKFGFIYGSYITKITTAKKTTKTQYRVQTGAYSVYENARASTFTLQDAGFDAVVIKSGTLNIVQLGMFDSLANANALRDKAKEAGFDAVVIAVKV